MTMAHYYMRYRGIDADHYVCMARPMDPEEAYEIMRGVACWVVYMLPAHAEPRYLKAQYKGRELYMVEHFDRSRNETVVDMWLRSGEEMPE